MPHDAPPNHPPNHPNCPCQLTGPDEEHGKMLVVPIIAGFPIIPQFLEGRPVDLDAYLVMEVRQEDGETVYMHRLDFFRKYIPTRLMFANAGRG